MKKSLFSLALCVLLCHPQFGQTEDTNQFEKSEKIQVLNFATVHLSMTSDAISSQINLNDPNEQASLKKLVEKIVAFKPTIICLELEPKNNKYIADTFLEYKNDQSKRLNYSDELNAIGLEVARLSGTDRIYGIDSQSGFNYPALIEIANNDPVSKNHVASVMDNYKKVNALKFKEQYKAINTKEFKMKTFDFYNFLATQHTEGKQEGATEIAKFFERNLKMYSHFNDIEMTKEDRVFILLGATHTAYFDVFLENSPNFSLEDPEKYTNY